MLAHPVQRVDQIQLASVAGVAQAFVAAFAQVEIAERVESVVDGDDDYIATAAQVRPVVQRMRAGAVVVATAMNVEKDRSPAAITQRGRVHIEEQAVFADRLVVGVTALRGGSAVAGRIAYATPGQLAGGALESACRGIRAVGHAEEGMDAALGPAGDAATACGRDGGASGGRSTDGQRDRQGGEHGRAGALDQELAAQRRVVGRSHGNPEMTPVSKG